MCAGRARRPLLFYGALLCQGKRGEITNLYDNQVQEADELGKEKRSPRVEAATGGKSFNNCKALLKSAYPALKTDRQMDSMLAYVAKEFAV